MRENWPLTFRFQGNKAYTPAGAHRRDKTDSGGTLACGNTVADRSAIGD